MTPRRRAGRGVLAAAFLSLLLAQGLWIPAALAHAPDPVLGPSTWGQDAVLGYTWAAGQVPPAWMAGAIDLGAGDVGESRRSRAALFARQSGAPGKIAYGGAVPCSSYGIACMDRSDMPDSWGMWFRPHGYQFDWGTLRWCQAQSTPTNGCYDAENVALDEFGHVEILGHHDNFADESDFTDAVVQFAARSRPKAGWDQHFFGRCDVARLQLEYDVPSATEPISTCLALSTALSFSVARTVVESGSSVRVSGTLKVASSTSVKRLSGNWLSNRTVVLQQRAIGGATWASIGTLAAVAGTDGAYALTIRPTQSYDYRLVFARTAGEGLLATTSAVIRIETYVACDTSVAKAPHVACG